MREILFRGKRVDNDEWIKGDLLQNIDCIKIREHEKSIKAIAKSFVVYPETVGQYTGLTDKNGKKIFEGDIVQLSKGGGKWKVYFNEERLKFEMRELDSHIKIGVLCDVEVIGTIYDNPELLDVEVEGIELEDEAKFIQEMLKDCKEAYYDYSQTEETCRTLYQKGYRKQSDTAREFLKLLKEKESPKLLTWEYGEGYLDCIKTAEELAAEYGVEVEE